MQKRFLPLAFLGAVVFISCGDSPPTEAERRSEVIRSMHDSIAVDLANLASAARDLQNAAPTGHGWSVTADAAAITAMKAAWRRTRIAYELTEGAVAPIFPDFDVAIDFRYDDFLADLGGDSNLFDGQGVTGMHAVERILYSDSVRDEVRTFEVSLPGYEPARFPADAAEAMAFKAGLLQRLVDDTAALKAQWDAAGTTLDIGGAFQGLVSLMNEQAEKVNKAATGEEESRYAQMTLFDLKNNLEGTTKIYRIFQPWARDKAAAADTNVTKGFDDLNALYSSYSGDEIPQPPPTWSSDNPSEADKATDFGRLFVRVHQAVDPTAKTSVVSSMNAVAIGLGFPEFVQE